MDPSKHQAANPDSALTDESPASARDIKPSNIMIAGSGDKQTAYVVDFGIAKELYSILDHVPRGVNMSICAV